MKRITSFLLFVAMFATFTIYESTSAPRMVLLEEFTNASCAPCAAQNPTLKAYLKNNMDKVIPLIYHWYFPGNDVMHNFNKTMALERAKYYGVNGVPTLFIEGIKPTKSNPNYYDGAPIDTNAYRNNVNNLASTQSPITITPTFTYNNASMDIKVNVTSTSNLTNKILRVAVVEAFHFYENAGSNGEKDFYYIVREMLPNYSGTPISLTANENKELQFSYLVSNELHKGFMYVVAFVQDDATKEVLQVGASWNPSVAEIEAKMVKGQVTVNASSKHGFVEDGTPSPRTFTVKNTLNIPVNFKFIASITQPNLDWNVTLDKSEATIPANGAVDVVATVNAGALVSYSGVKLEAIPQQLPDDKVGMATEDLAFAMHKNAKTIYFINPLDNFSQFVIRDIMLTKVKNNTVLMSAFDQESISAYPITNFDNFIFSFDYFGVAQVKGILSNNYGESQLIRNTIKSAYDANKKVLVIAENEAYLANTNSGSSAGKAYFESFFGINSIKTDMKVTINSQGLITGVLPYTLDGVAGDPIGDGLSFNVSNSTSSPVIFVDNLTLSIGSKSVPFLYLDGDKTKTVAVHVENTTGGKLVYMSNPIHGMLSANSTLLLNKIFDWFTSSAQTDGPKISTTTTNYDFGDVNLNESKEHKLTFTNTGDEQLIISNVELLNNSEGSFTITAGSGATTVEPGNSLDVTVKFTPTESKKYTANLVITSNAKNEQSTLVTLRGESTSSIGEFGDKFYLNITPNPVNESSVINYQLNTENPVNLKIKMINVTGEEVAQFQNGLVATGNYNTPLNIKNFTSGTYYIVVELDGKVQSMPIIITR